MPDPKPSRQIRLMLRGRAQGITPEICHLNVMADEAGLPISLIPAERVAAARHCPRAALQLQQERATRSLRIYQTALSLAHQITQQLAEIEDAA